MSMFQVPACARWENEMQLVNHILEWIFVGAGM